MNIKRIIAIAAAAAMLALSAACGNSTSSQTSDGASAETTADLTSPTGYYRDDVIAAVDGPKLSFSNVEVAAGETAEVSLFVSGAHKNWTMCGIHVTFGDELECVMSDAEQHLVEYELGDASRKSNGSVCMLWVKELPEELTSNHLGSLFFTEIFDGNMGADGEIVKFFFKVPKDAKKGTVYPIGIYYMTDNDMFINAEGDKPLEKYAFQNWVGGSVTVK